MKKLVRRALALLLLAAVLSVLPLAGEGEIYHRIVRLHVIAQNDSEEALREKLGVRDAILPAAAELLSGCTTRDEAMEVLGAHLSDLRRTAEDYLASVGSDAEVNVTLSREDYPTREYAGCRLPAGVYDSLRVRIGDAQGQNWWCVLFPSLCLSASKGEAEEAFLSAGLTPGQVRVLTDGAVKYRVKFRIVEWIEGLFGERGGD